jgi:hypothetical protein
MRDPRMRAHLLVDGSDAQGPAKIDSSDVIVRPPA